MNSRDSWALCPGDGCVSQDCSLASLLSSRCMQPALPGPPGVLLAPCLHRGQHGACPISGRCPEPPWVPSFPPPPHSLSSVSSASVPPLAPVGRASLDQALAVHGLFSPPHAVPSQLALLLLTLVFFLRCFLKELRPCFVSVGVLQRERTIRMCVYGEIYFKELALMIVVAGKSEICTASQLAGNPGRTSRLPSGGRISSPGNLKFCS